MTEPTKTATRMTLLGAASTVLTYAVTSIFKDMPAEVVMAVVFIGMVFLDSAIHHAKSGFFKDITGIIPF